MNFRLKAFSLHLLASACVLTIVLGGLYLGWYQWPGWYLTGLLHILLICILVDLVLGPLLTFVVANPAKPRRELARDITIIAAVQLAALVYGASTMWRGRPLYYTFSQDRLEIVQASDLEVPDIARGRKENPALAPYWHSRPQWVWAPLPDDPQVAARIMASASFGGKDVIDMPWYFQPWSEGLPRLRTVLRPVNEIKALSPAEKLKINGQIKSAGLDPLQRNALLWWGHTRRLVAVFDPESANIRVILKPD